MHVHSDPEVDTPRGGEAEVRHLGADAGEGEQAGQRGGDVGEILGLEDGGGELDVAGFGVVEADFGDEGV